MTSVSGSIEYVSQEHRFDDVTTIETTVPIRRVSPQAALATIKEVEEGPWEYLERVDAARYLRHERTVLRRITVALWVFSAEGKQVVYSRRL